MGFLGVCWGSRWMMDIQNVHSRYALGLQRSPPESKAWCPGWEKQSGPQRWASASPASHTKPPTLRFSPSLWGGFGEPWKVKWPLGRNQKKLWQLLRRKRPWLDVVFLCDPWRALCWIAFHSNAHTHALCLVFAVEYSERFLMIYVSLRSHSPVLTLWLLLGFASPPNIFVKCKRGNLSDGWRLDWCVCRKSVNNINFIWINKKEGSGNSHVGFFQVILLSRW